jgi:hypothetical protein
MARLTTTAGDRSIETTLTDAAAAAACRRVPANHKDGSFARDLARAFNRFGSALSQNRRVWLHIVANQQIRRETPAPAAAPALTAAPAVATPAAAPVTLADAVPAAPLMSADAVEAAAAGLSITMVMYDIPEVADIDNPSGQLRRIGVRLNKSVWLVPTGNVPHHLIARLEEVGSDVVTAPYDTRAAAKLLRAAIKFAGKEMAAMKKRNEVAAAAALAKLNAPGGDPTTKRRRYEREIAAIAKRLETMADEMAVGAGVFGIAGAMEFGTLRNAARSISATTTARATAYAHAATVLAASDREDARAVAVLMERDEMPAIMAAGMLEDSGMEEEGEALAAAFTALTDADGPDVFSLAGEGDDE